MTMPDLRKRVRKLCTLSKGDRNIVAQAATIAEREGGGYMVAHDIDIQLFADDICRFTDDTLKVACRSGLSVTRKSDNTLAADASADSHIARNVSFALAAVASVRTMLLLSVIAPAVATSRSHTGRSATCRKNSSIRMPLTA